VKDRIVCAVMRAVKDVIRLWDEILNNTEVRCATKEQIMNSCDQACINPDIGRLFCSKLDILMYYSRIFMTRTGN